MKKTTKYILPIVILIGGFILMQLLTSMKEEKEKKPVEIPTKIVETQIVKLSNVISNVTGYGRIVTSQPLDIYGEVSGILEKGDIPFKPSENFKKGDLLFKIDPRQAQMNLNSAKSNLMNALASLLPDIKVDFPDEFGKWQRYFSSINFESKLQELPEVSNEKLKLYLSRYNVYSLYFNVIDLEIVLDKHFFRAKFDGSIVNTTLREGAAVRNGSLIGSIINLNDMEVALPIETKDVFWIKKNSTVELTSSEFPGVWSGHIDRIGKEINDMTQTVDIYVVLDNDDQNQILNGLFLKADFPGLAVENAVSIPPRAVYENKYVYLIENGKLNRVDIEIARRELDQIIISNGLKDGDVLVTEIMQGVSSGMPAKPKYESVEEQSN